MKRRRRLFLALVLLLVMVGLLLVPSVRWPIYGWLRGEPFYRGMPASWWANEIGVRYHGGDAYGIRIAGPDEAIPPDQLSLRDRNGGPGSREIVVRRPTQWQRHSQAPWDEQLKERLGYGDSSASMARFMADVSTVPPLLDGDPAGLPVLLTLLQNQNPKVRQVAVSGLAAFANVRPEVVPLLRAALDDPDDEVRKEAAVRLEKIDADAKANIK